MYSYDVDGVSAMLTELRNLPVEQFEQEVSLIENDLKGYALSKFKFDPYQNSTIERVGPETWARLGAKFADSLRNGDEIEPAPAAKGKCPVKITITISF